MPEKKKHPGGRPRKFKEPSHPVTVTLPERTLRLLESLEHDRARGIVRAVDMALPDYVPPSQLVEVAQVAKGVGMVVVPPCAALRKIKILRLLEVAPSRFLLALPTGTALSELEVALVDLLDEVPGKAARERAILGELLGLFRRLRRGDQVSKAEMLFVAL